jgi:hypothetical protein
MLVAAWLFAERLASTTAKPDEVWQALLRIGKIE